MELQTFTPISRTSNDILVFTKVKSAKVVTIFNSQQ
ncbi:hypothetical protein swp_0582 [Shewanella piezotolerans WP3]|uniref:Uncharacterized protein n=1 Tax=Shewanella piezotolerans (strain WP3 / JCM 13877) TaxID=225849 RepID=B8CID1_SHEPW|nr:hypothetical protein swp_0582 [Shewanella piezotolerans WP3]